MIALVSAVAFPAAALVIWAALRSPLARIVVARPSSERWHERETPSVGGTGIFLGVLAGLGAAMAAGAIHPSRELLAIIGAIALLYVVGLADDLFALPPWAKVAAQGAAAGIVISNGLTVELVKNDWIAVPIGVVWLVGMTNAFNLLDNMDGIAATLAGIACAFFAIDAVAVHSDRLVLVLSLSVALACAGFLPFNVRLRGPALAFMGDSGSQVLGFSLGAIALASSWKVAAPSLATVLLPIVVLAIPILDTTFVMIVRLLEGRPVTAGGRDHTAHRLVYRGLSERRTLLLLAVIAAALGATSLAYNAAGNSVITIVGVLITFALLVQLAGFLGELDRAPGEVDGRSFVRRAFELHRGRLVEVLVDFALITAAFACAYLLRFEGGGPPNQRHLFLSALPVLLAARYATFIVLGLYSSVWRYMSARDAIRIPIAVALSEGIAVLYLVLSQTHSFAFYSRSVFVIDALLCTLLIGASRLGERGIVPFLSSLGRGEAKRRTLIVGAGRGGRSLLRELRETPGEHVVGFVDDDPRLRHRRVHGVPVLGSASEIEGILRQKSPDAVLITIPDAPREQLELVLEGCAGAGIECGVVRRRIELDPVAALGPVSK
jgi:UDP-GlcNAc:undecaprenyl-phosphate/decaprenyl-phosphate GlcNAc-1-phosphate transferase